MDMNPQQQSVALQFEAFIHSLVPRYDPPYPGTLPQVFYIGGYAGTGKTTMLKEIAGIADGWLDQRSDLGGQVRIAAPTNKAAKRLRDKIGRDANTLHWLLGATPVTHLTSHIPQIEKKLEENEALYKEEPKDTLKEKIDKAKDLLATLYQIETLEKQLETASPNLINGLAERIQALQEKLTEFPIKGSSLGHNDIVICDESSMVSIDLRDKVYARSPLAVIWVGDPGQLDPVKSPRWFEPSPQCTLTRVMRQGSDSGVLKLATMIRERCTADTRWLARSLGRCDDVEFLFAKDGDIVDWARLADDYGDRWLTWRNGFKTRNHPYHTRSLNVAFRYTLGFETPYPQPSDRLYITDRFINRCKSAKSGSVWLSKGEECEVIAAGSYNESLADLLALNMSKATQQGFERRTLSAKNKLLLEQSAKKPTCICDVMNAQEEEAPLFCNGRVAYYKMEGFGHPWGGIAEEAQGIHAFVKDERGMQFATLLDPSDLIWNDDQRNEIWRVDQRYLRESGGDATQSKSPVKSLMKASYGYCISVHQSQGSEWPRVCVYFDPVQWRTDPKNAVKWLYTAVSRASERVCIVTI